jgi:hypothetical protein
MKYFMLILAPILLFSCGDAVVDLDTDNYEPKIVMEGYIYPEQPVTNIRISRNLPLGGTINLNDVFLEDATVSITDLRTGTSYPLTYTDFPSFTYINAGIPLIIQYNQSYRLDVSATIDNQQLSASSITTVPGEGFGIDRGQSFLGPLTYNAKDENDESRFITIQFNRAENVGFYILSIISEVPQEDLLDSLILDNLVGLERKDIEEADDPAESLRNLAIEEEFLINLPETNGTSVIEVPWLDQWFYGGYRGVLYAGDQNFKDYYLTHGSVQAIDGNLNEPIFHIDGDGIGVFAGVVTDTVFWEIIR